MRHWFVSSASCAADPRVRFDPPLEAATLVRRYKRFLADVRLDDGRSVTLHCPNTGAMTGCAEPGMRIWYSASDNPRRKYRYTWELSETASGALLCVHSQRANGVVREALEAGNLDLGPFRTIRREPRTPDGHGRFDLALEADLPVVIEVKSVTLCEGGAGLFPDTESVRARRHLEQLRAARAAGQRAVLVFAALHSAVCSVGPADAIDPAYGRALREAHRDGVEVFALRASLSPHALGFGRLLPVSL